jgi:hypothetical protein
MQMLYCRLVRQHGDQWPNTTAKVFALLGTARGGQIPSTANGSKRQDQGGPNKRTMQRLLLTLGLVAISLRSALYAEDPIRYDPVSRQVIEGRLQKYVGNDKQREDTPRQMFSQAGHLGWSGARHAFFHL